MPHALDMVRGTKVYTKGVLGSEKPRASAGPKRGLVYIGNTQACTKIASFEKSPELANHRF